MVPRAAVVLPTVLLVREYIFGLFVQFVGVKVDEFHIPPVLLLLGEGRGIGDDEDDVGLTCAHALGQSQPEAAVRGDGYGLLNRGHSEMVLQARLFVKGREQTTNKEHLS
jgi:hypothetical protein